MSGDRVRARPIADAVVRDGEAAVLMEGSNSSLLRVSALALAAHELAGDGRSVEDVTVDLVARFGQPGGDAVTAVRSLLRELVGAGLLEWVGEPVHEWPDG